MRLGVLGGTFDPVHLGHLIVAEEALVQLNLDRVLFIPAGQPWLKAGLALSPTEDRLRMVELAISSNPHFQVARNEVDRPGATYTVDTLRELAQEWGEDAELHFILGLDTLEQFHRWKEPEQLLELGHLAVVTRPGYHQEHLTRLLARYPQAADRVTLLETPTIDISATEIRRRAAEGISFRYQVPDPVAQYILGHRLYRSNAAIIPDYQITASGGNPGE